MEKQPSETQAAKLSRDQRDGFAAQSAPAKAGDDLKSVQTGRVRTAAEEDPADAGLNRSRGLRTGVQNRWPCNVFRSIIW